VVNDNYGSDDMNECKITPNDCIIISYLIESAQRNINEADSTIEMINKLPNLPGRDTFIKELDKARNRDGERLTDSIETLKNCGCKDIGIAVLFA